MMTSSVTGMAMATLHSPARLAAHRRAAEGGRLILRPMGHRRVANSSQVRQYPAGTLRRSLSAGAVACMNCLLPLRTPCHPMATSTKNSTNRDGETNRNQEDGETNRYREDGETNRYRENGETNRYRHDGYQEGDDGELPKPRRSHPHDHGHGMNQPVAAPPAARRFRAPPQHVAHPAPYVRAPCLPAASSGPRDVGNPDGSYYAPGTMAAGALRRPRAMTSGRGGAHGGVRRPPVQQHRPYPHPQQRQRETAEGGVAVCEDEQMEQEEATVRVYDGLRTLPAALHYSPARHEVEREIELTPIFVDEDGTESCADGGVYGSNHGGTYSAAVSAAVSGGAYCVDGGTRLGASSTNGHYDDVIHRYASRHAARRTHGGTSDPATRREGPPPLPRVAHLVRGIPSLVEGGGQRRRDVRGQGREQARQQKPQQALRPQPPQPPPGPHSHEFHQPRSSQRQPWQQERKPPPVATRSTGRRRRCRGSRCRAAFAAERHG